MLNVIVMPKLTVPMAELEKFDREQANQMLWAAIDKVRDMDAEELKQLVIDGLQDADGYPNDFAEY
jgi:hypothetical protein